MNDWAILSLSAFMAALVPDIALGASVGSLFYLLSERRETAVRKTLLMIVGWVSGYALGQPFYEGGWAMLIAILGSAFAVSVMLQMSDSFNSADGKAPPFTGWLIDLYHKIRRG